MKKFILWITILSLLASGAMLTLAQDDPEPTPDSGTIEIDIDAASEDVAQAAEAVTEAATNTFQDFVNTLNNAPENSAVLIVLVIGGALLLTIGWRIYEYVILIAGGVVGASVGAALVAGESAIVEIAALLIGGIIGMALAAFVYTIAVFFIGAYMGIVLTGAAADLFDLTPVSGLVVLIGALIGGLVAVGLSTELLVILSALVGAQMLVVALNLDPIWIAILAVAGIAIQVLASNRFGYSLRRRPGRRRLLPF